MKASELRLGNLIKQGEIDMLEVRRVDGVDTINCIRVDGSNVVNPEPMLLSPEVLLRFGFKKGHGSNELYFHYSTLGYVQNNAPGCHGNFGYCTDEERMIFVELEYVHQLQNLVFYLEGEELKDGSKDRDTG